MPLIRNREGIDNLLLSAREFVVRESLILINEDTVAEHISLTKELKTVWEDAFSETVDVLYATSKEYPLSKVPKTQRDSLLKVKYIENSFILTRDEVKEYLLTH